MSAIEHIWAGDVREGDELLIGPQGFRCPTAPTICFIRRAIDSVHGTILTAELRDEQGTEVVKWSKHSRLTVMRRSES